MDNENVVPFQAGLNRKREPALTDAELLAIRAMLERFEVITTECPVARRILRDAGL